MHGLLEPSRVRSREPRSTETSAESSQVGGRAKRFCGGLKRSRIVLDSPFKIHRNVLKLTRAKSEAVCFQMTNLLDALAKALPPVANSDKTAVVCSAFALNVNTALEKLRSTEDSRGFRLAVTRQHRDFIGNYVVLACHVHGVPVIELDQTTEFPMSKWINFLKTAQVLPLYKLDEISSPISASSKKTNVQTIYNQMIEDITGAKEEAVPTVNAVGRPLTSESSMLPVVLRRQDVSTDPQLCEIRKRSERRMKRRLLRKQKLNAKSEKC